MENSSSFQSPNGRIGPLAQKQMSHPLKKQYTMLRQNDQYYENKPPEVLLEN